MCVRCSTYEKKSAKAQTIPFKRTVSYYQSYIEKEKKKKNTRCREITNYKCNHVHLQLKGYYIVRFFLRCFYTRNSLLFYIEMQVKKIKSEGILNEFTTEIAFCYSTFLTFFHLPKKKKNFIFVYLKINFCVDFTFKNTLRKLIFVSV